MDASSICIIVLFFSRLRREKNSTNHCLPKKALIPSVDASLPNEHFAGRFLQKSYAKVLCIDLVADWRVTLFNDKSRAESNSARLTSV
jgi:hypothetical protein